MERKPHVVLGEAPESDSEEEVNASVLQFKRSQIRQTASHNPQGVIVAGEAPESDEEHEEDPGSMSSVSSAASVSSLVSLTSGNRRNKIPAKTKKADDAMYNTLLHRKLRERNMSLHKNVNDFANQAITAADRSLNTMNQQLLHAQCQLQEAEMAVRVLQTHLMQLQVKLNAVVSTAFLPPISSLATHTNESKLKQSTSQLPYC